MFKPSKKIDPNSYYVKTIHNIAKVSYGTICINCNKTLGEHYSTKFKKLYCTIAEIDGLETIKDKNECPY